MLRRGDCAVAHAAAPSAARVGRANRGILVYYEYGHRARHMALLALLACGARAHMARQALFPLEKGPPLRGYAEP